jgi:hypothetical protein
MRLISLKKQGGPALLESAPGSTRGGCFSAAARIRGSKRCRRFQWRIVALFGHSGYWAYFKELEGLSP